MIGSMHIYPDPEQLSRAAAERWVKLAKETIESRGKFHVALAGGSTPRRLYEILASPEFHSLIPWHNVYIYFGDERAVSPESPESNYRMVKEAWLDHVPISADHIFRIKGEDEDPANAATAYARTLSAQLPMTSQGIVRFDLILLGMGPDGHIASLFPGTPILRERARLADAVFVEKLNSWRISITLPVIDAARHIFIMVTGENKANIVNTVFTNRRTPPLPIQLINPSGVLDWFLDQAAAHGLPPELRS